MDLYAITEDYAVAPQIPAEAFGAIAAAGFTTVICNRPDAENPPALHMVEMRVAAEAAGLTFIENPVVPGGFSEEVIDRQRGAAQESAGPVLAYCASGTRSAVLWALCQTGSQPVDEILQATAHAGFALDGLAPHLHSRANAASSL